MRLIRLTHNNATNYIGFPILFKSRGEFIVKKIVSVSPTSITIEHSDLNNCLQFGRKIFVIIE